MLQQLVANWLRQQAKEALLHGLRPDDQAESVEGEDLPVEVALFFPSAGEAIGLVDGLSGKTSTQCSGFIERIGVAAGKQLAIIEASLPAEQLAHAANDVIQLHKPKWVIASGFAAAASERVKRGHLLVSNRIIDGQGYSLAIDAKMSESQGLHVGTLLSSSEEPSTEVADALARESQAAVIGEVCRLLKTRMMAIHCITSRVGQKQTNVVAEKIKSQDSIAGWLGAAAGALIDQPSSVKRMLTDKGTNLVFTDRLAKFLLSIVSQL